MKNKRVVQISLDIVVGCECDGMELADDVADELETRGYRVLGAGFQDDMTECYVEHYPELFT
jgi:ribose 5-phosphate isomerase RpiB